MDLTTTARVLKIIPTANAADTSQLIAQLVTGISGQVERFLDRTIEETSGIVEYLDAEPGQEFWSLRGYPVSDVTEIKFDPLRAWGADVHDVTDDSADAWYMADDDEEDRLYIASPLAFGHRVLKVTYDGGMAADTDAFVTAYPDIANAVDLWVADVFQRRNSLSLQQQSDGGQTLQFHLLRMLPQVKDALVPYRRFPYGM